MVGRPGTPRPRYTRAHHLSTDHHTQTRAASTQSTIAPRGIGFRNTTHRTYKRPIRRISMNMCNVTCASLVRSAHSRVVALRKTSHDHTHTPDRSHTPEAAHRLSFVHLDKNLAERHKDRQAHDASLHLACLGCVSRCRLAVQGMLPSSSRREVLLPHVLLYVLYATTSAKHR